MSVPVENVPGGSGNVPAFLVELGIGIVRLLAGDISWEQFLQELLDPWDLWFGNFVGRPKVGPDSATEAIVQFLAQSPNPVVKWYAIGIRSFEALGIPVSVSHGIWRQRYDRLATEFVKDLQRQWGQADGEDKADKWFLALKDIDSGLGQSIRATQDHLYKEAVRDGRIDPKTGYPVAVTPHEPIFPPVLHPQPQGCTDPCQLELIAQIELVVAQLQAATTPLTAIIENLPLFIQALQNLSNPAVANALQNLVDCICPALDTIAREISNPARASDHDYTEELKSIAQSLATTPDDTARLNSVVDYLENIGAFDPGVAQMVRS